MILHPSDFTSRQVGAAAAMRVAFSVLALTASVGIGKALMTHALAPSVTKAVAAPTQQVTQVAMAKDTCRQVTVETDEGYGVRGEITRWVCRRAL
jgi:hypothetical protein